MDFFRGGGGGGDGGGSGDGRFNELNAMNFGTDEQDQLAAAGNASEFGEDMVMSMNDVAKMGASDGQGGKKPIPEMVELDDVLSAANDPRSQPTASGPHQMAEAGSGGLGAGNDQGSTSKPPAQGMQDPRLMLLQQYLPQNQPQRGPSPSSGTAPQQIRQPQPGSTPEKMPNSMASMEQFLGIDLSAKGPNETLDRLPQTSENSSTSRGRISQKDSRGRGRPPRGGSEAREAARSKIGPGARSQDSVAKGPQNPEQEMAVFAKLLSEQTNKPSAAPSSTTANPAALVSATGRGQGEAATRMPWDDVQPNKRLRAGWYPVAPDGTPSMDDFGALQRQLEMQNWNQGQMQQQKPSSVPGRKPFDGSAGAERNQEPNARGQMPWNVQMEQMMQMRQGPQNVEQVRQMTMKQGAQPLNAKGGLSSLPAISKVDQQLGGPDALLQQVQHGSAEHQGQVMQRGKATAKRSPKATLKTGQPGGVEAGMAKHIGQVANAPKAAAKLGGSVVPGIAQQQAGPRGASEAAGKQNLQNVLWDGQTMRMPGSGGDHPAQEDGKASLNPQAMFRQMQDEKQQDQIQRQNPLMEHFNIQQPDRSFPPKRFHQSASARQLDQILQQSRAAAKKAQGMGAKFATDQFLDNLLGAEEKDAGFSNFAAMEGSDSRPMEVLEDFRMGASAPLPKLAAQTETATSDGAERAQKMTPAGDPGRQSMSIAASPSMEESMSMRVGSQKSTMSDARSRTSEEPEMAQVRRTTKKLTNDVPWLSQRMIHELSEVSQSVVSKWIRNRDPPNSEKARRVAETMKRVLPVLTRSAHKYLKLEAFEAGEGVNLAKLARGEGGSGFQEEQSRPDTAKRAQSSAPKYTRKPGSGSAGANKVEQDYAPGEITTLQEAAARGAVGAQTIDNESSSLTGTNPRPQEPIGGKHMPVDKLDMSLSYDDVNHPDGLGGAPMATGDALDLCLNKDDGADMFNNPFSSSVGSTAISDLGLPPKTQSEIHAIERAYHNLVKPAWSTTGNDTAERRYVWMEVDLPDSKGHPVSKTVVVELLNTVDTASVARSIRGQMQLGGDSDNLIEERIRDKLTELGIPCAQREEKAVGKGRKVIDNLHRISIKVEVEDDRGQKSVLMDKFDWDFADTEAVPERFAEGLCADLGLGARNIKPVANAIRAELVGVCGGDLARPMDPAKSGLRKLGEEEMQDVHRDVKGFVGEMLTEVLDFAYERYTFELDMRPDEKEAQEAIQEEDLVHRWQLQKQRQKAGVKSSIPQLGNRKRPAKFLPVPRAPPVEKPRVHAAQSGARRAHSLDAAVAPGGLLVPAQQSAEAPPVAPVKRKRGRPRKHPLPGTVGRPPKSAVAAVAPQRHSIGAPGADTAQAESTSQVATLPEPVAIAGPLVLAGESRAHGTASTADVQLGHAYNQDLGPKAVEDTATKADKTQEGGRGDNAMQEPEHVTPSGAK